MRGRRENTGRENLVGTLSLVGQTDGQLLRNSGWTNRNILGKRMSNIQAYTNPPM